MTSAWKKVQDLYDIDLNILLPIRKHVNDANDKIAPFASKLGLKRVDFQLVEVFTLAENASYAIMNKGDKIEKKNVKPYSMGSVVIRRESEKALIESFRRESKTMLTRTNARAIVASSITSVGEAIELIKKVNNVGPRQEILAKNGLKRVMWSCVKIEKILDKVQTALKAKSKALSSKE